MPRTLEPMDRLECNPCNPRDMVLTFMAPRSAISRGYHSLMDAGQCHALAYNSG